MALEDKNWLVCYCRSKYCLPLTAKINDMGFKAACPYFTFRRRAARRNKIEFITKPLIGGTIFIDLFDYPSILQLGWQAGFDLSTLRPLRIGNKIMKISQEEIDWLNFQGEKQSVKKMLLEKGDAVEIVFGPMSGIKCKIVGIEQSIVTVDSEGALGKIKIAPFLLRKNQA